MEKLEPGAWARCPYLFLGVGKLETVAWQFRREAQSQTCRRQKPG